MKNPLVLALLLVFSPLAIAASSDAEAPAVDPADDTVLISAAGTDIDKRCVRETGTRTPKRDKDGCNGRPGESYDREQIDRTGAVDTADAIRKLSPAATVRR